MLAIRGRVWLCRRTDQLITFHWVQGGYTTSLYAEYDVCYYCSCCSYCSLCCIRCGLARCRIHDCLSCVQTLTKVVTGNTTSRDTYIRRNGRPGIAGYYRGHSTHRWSGKGQYLCSTTRTHDDEGCHKNTCEVLSYYLNPVALCVHAVDQRTNLIHLSNPLASLHNFHQESRKRGGDTVVVR